MRDYHPCPLENGKPIKDISHLNCFEIEGIKRLARSVLDRVLRKDTSKNSPEYKRHKAMKEIPFNNEANSEIKRIANIFNVDLQIAKSLLIWALRKPNYNSDLKGKKWWGDDDISYFEYWEKKSQES